MCKVGKADLLSVLKAFGFKELDTITSALDILRVEIPSPADVMFSLRSYQATRTVALTNKNKEGVTCFTVLFVPLLFFREETCHLLF